MKANHYNVVVIILQNNPATKGKGFESNTDLSARFSPILWRKLDQGPRNLGRLKPRGHPA